MELTTVWFLLIAFLWVGYLVLEGFDFGVGVLLGLLARDDAERTALVRTIGPVWDGNEVWLIVAGGATFAAFPEWYATLFSGFYLPLLAILLALIVRVIGLEFRSKRPETWWRRRCDVAIAVGSLLPAVLWGVALASVVRGVPIDADGEFVGSLTDLLQPYALLGGAAFLLLFVVHGACFVALRTDGPVRVRARALAVRWGAPAALATAVFVLWTARHDGGTAVQLTAVAAAVLLPCALLLVRAGREGLAFTATALAVALVVVTLFAALFPDVMPSTLDPAWSLTVDSAASGAYTLRIMTWVAAFFTPVVLLYQGWTYRVFRHRVTAAPEVDPRATATP